MKTFGILILFMAGFAVPVEYIQFFWVAGFVITPAKVATGLLVVWALFLTVFSSTPSRGVPLKHIAMLAYGFAALIGLMVSLLGGLPVSRLVAVASTWLFLIIFYFTLGRSLVSRSDVDVFLAGVGIGAVFVTLSGLLGVGFQTESEQGVRIGGFGGNSNELAMNLLIAIAIAGYFITGSRAGRIRALWVVAMPILIFGLISTLSRSGMLALVVMGGLWMFRFRRFDTLKFAIPALLVAVGLFALSPDALVERLETMQPDKIGSDSSIQSRLKNYPYALKALASNPVTGVGLLGSLSYIFSESDGVSGTNVIHNMFLQVGAELGLLGLLPLIAIVWITWRDCSRCWFVTRSGSGWRDPELRRLGLMAAFLQIAFLGTLLLGQFQPTHNQRGLWLLYAITPALVRLVSTRKNEVGAAEPTNGQGAPDELLPQGTNLAPGA